MGLSGSRQQHDTKKLKETVKQTDPNEDLSLAIDNWDEVEFSFRHTDVKHFKRKQNIGLPTGPTKTIKAEAAVPSGESSCSWSILLPICSRNQQRGGSSALKIEEGTERYLDANRFHDLTLSSQYNNNNRSEDCWDRLKKFGQSLKMTSSPELLDKTECVVGIDVDDPVYRDQEESIQQLLPCRVRFVEIYYNMYGKICRIWNHLGAHASNDFIVLLGDDIVLLDKNWQVSVETKFHSISVEQGLVFGAACVALNDLAFPGFPTFPVVHRWHLDHFDSILPRQFVNQGGDPYLFELYSRFNAAAFLPQCRLKNTIDGDDEARYKKYEINWKGQILRLNLSHMQEFIERRKNGVCIDIVVPSYRLNNSKILGTILSLKCSVDAYVKFWLVIDNPHLTEIKILADLVNKERFNVDGNYYVSVLHYGENRGASYARNLGYNYSTADWTLFLDDDVVPDEHLLDAQTISKCQSFCWEY